MALCKEISKHENMAFILELGKDHPRTGHEGPDGE